MEYIEETPRYKKKSQAKPPKKSKHKHVYEPCVLEYIYPYAECVSGQGFKSGRGERIDGYCPICGKIGPTDMTRWYKIDCDLSSKRWGHKTELSDEAIKELNPDTRTLPTFDVGDDWLFPKFVTLPEVLD